MASIDILNNYVLNKSENKRNNPGNNLPGQPSRAMKHHVGPINIGYIEDATKRSQTLSKRRSTIFKKMEELSKLTKSEFICQWKSPTGSCGLFKSDGNGASETEKEVTATEVSTGSTGTDAVAVTEKDQEAEPSYPAPVIVTADEDNETAENGKNKTKCDICHQENVSKKKNEVWLNCEYRKGCDFWVHTLCIGIVVKRDRDLDGVKYFCPNHIKVLMK